jgi:hypothetical protein
MEHETRRRNQEFNNKYGKVHKRELKPDEKEPFSTEGQEPRSLYPQRRGVI